jgi:hypothetical protein
MDLGAILGRLNDLELSIGVESNTALRLKVIDAQDCILAMQKAAVEDLRRKSARAAGERFPTSRYAA